ncbi:MAG: nucleoside kinase [Butyricicoccus sp.]|nr:nucleoside kinase [Butyricicoccus sp.]
MAKYQLDWINTQAKQDPAGFIAACEKQYLDQIDAVAESLAEARDQKPIALLCGPSSSGKTTTADRLRRALDRRGVHVETISMDDYYLSRGAYDMPWDEENGVYDFESPLCMDLPLLHDHLAKLARGQEINIPTFDFAHKMRTSETKSLTLDPDEIVVIEGIHAFNDVLMGGLERHATGIYISVASSVQADGWEMEAESLRFCRRAVRDANFRGAPVESTIQQWRSVRRGERLYIDPYRSFATHTIDSYLPYETCILLDVLREQTGQRTEELEKAGLPEISRAAQEFASIDYKPYMPEASVLHEFIG